MVGTWKKVVWALVLAFALSLAAEILTRRGAAGESGAGEIPSSDLRVSEFLAGPARDWDGDGAFDSRGDEWVELQNSGAVPLDLAGYRIADIDSTIRIALSGSLPPAGMIVVTGSQAVEWQRAVGRTVSGLSLNNAGDTVRLFQIVGLDTVEVDAHHYGSIEGAADRSTGRSAASPDAWALFDGLNPYTGSGQPQGTGCDPTPAGPNSCTTDVTQTSWGAIKRRFR
jgi:lamin tail-like protein